MDETWAVVIIAFLVAIVALAGIGGFTYTANQNNIKDQKFVTDCLDKLGSIAYTDEYKMKCLLPKAS